ncbi:lipoprotein LpqH [Nocardia asteroides]|uniref:lipoprotein LpqH n=1 Tax=Nocardia asteroides TaxID=1824 RepID=UPI001E5CA361|nr:lipoprotein LpqH [Nocardia asteroides]UGT62444.1 lipoprotein LpqH [Nocardia asteroides]
MRINRLAATTAAAAAALALLVTGCSDNSTDNPAPTSKAAPAAPSAGNSTAKVDGTTVDARFDTTCAKQGGTLALALTDLNNTTYGNFSVSATLQGEDTVQAVAIAGTKGGNSGTPYAVGYGAGAPGGSAKVTKNGTTYTVTGEGVGGVDLTNPLAGPKNIPFEITFACTTVVNG